VQAAADEPRRAHGDEVLSPAGGGGCGSDQSGKGSAIAAA
jgi:hypothetical protein